MASQPENYKKENLIEFNSVGGRNGINSNVIELTVITIKKSNNSKYYSLCMANMHVFLFVLLHC